MQLQTLYISVPDSMLLVHAPALFRGVYRVFV